MQAPVQSRLTALARKTDNWFQRANAALLSQVPCRAGCSRCCIGLFPITELDVNLLQEGLKRLSADERKVIRRRAAEQVSAVEAAYSQVRDSPYLDGWADKDIDRLVTEFHHFRCPALNEDGLCAVYEHRPLTCRSMGIPTEEGGVVTGACEVQSFVPVVRLSRTLRTEEDALSHQEAQTLEAHHSSARTEGEELLLPYGFVERH